MVLIPQKIFSDGIGDIAVNIKAAQMLKLSYPKAEIVFGVHPTAWEDFANLMGDKIKNFPSYPLFNADNSDNPHLPPSDYTFGFLWPDGSTLPRQIRAQSKTLFLHDHNSEPGLHLRKERPRAPLNPQQTIQALAEAGLKPQQAAAGKVQVKNLFAYSINSPLTGSYILAADRYAQTHPQEKFRLVYRDHDDLKELRKKVKSENLELIPFSRLPLEVVDSLIAHSDLPPLVTGMSSFATALDAGKLPIYTERSHNSQKFRDVLKTLTSDNAKDPLSNKYLELGFRRDQKDSGFPADHGGTIDRIVNIFEDQEFQKEYESLVQNRRAAISTQSYMERIVQNTALLAPKLESLPPATQKDIIKRISRFENIGQSLEQFEKNIQVHSMQAGNSSNDYTKAADLAHELGLWSEMKKVLPPEHWKAPSALTLDYVSLALKKLPTDTIEYYAESWNAFGELLDPESKTGWDAALIAAKNLLPVSVENSAPEPTPERKKSYLKDAIRMFCEKLFNRKS